MRIEFGVLEGQSPFEAKYIGYNSPALVPRLGYGGNSGQKGKTYGDLLEAVVRDLTDCPEKEIEAIFHNGISPEQQKITNTVLDLLVKYNHSREKLANIKQIVIGQTQV